MKKIQLLLVILLTLILYGRYGSVYEKDFAETLNNGLFQELELINKDIREENGDLNEPNKQDMYNVEMLKDVSYELYFENFFVRDENVHTDILIEYPQIKNMESQELEMKVNDLLKEKAISDYEGEDVVGLSLQMKTKIVWFNSNIISVKYSGYGYYHGGINGNNIIYATNIDLKTGKLIDIHELFNDGFSEKLNRNVFMYDGEEKAKQGEPIEPNTHEYEYINADESIISEMFNKYYRSLTNEKYYFSKEHFSLIVEVPSGPTAYLELVANYDDLKDCMNYDDGFWYEILK